MVARGPASWRAGRGARTTALREASNFLVYFLKYMNSFRSNFRPNWLELEIKSVVQVQ